MSRSWKNMAESVLFKWNQAENWRSPTALTVMHTLARRSTWSSANFSFFCFIFISSFQTSSLLCWCFFCRGTSLKWKYKFKICYFLLLRNLPKCTRAEKSQERRWEKESEAKLFCSNNDNPTYMHSIRRSIFPCFRRKDVFCLFIIYAWLVMISSALIDVTIGT